MDGQDRRHTANGRPVAAPVARSATARLEGGGESCKKSISRVKVLSMFVYWTRNYALRGIQGMLLFALMLYVEGYTENRLTNSAGLMLGVFGIEYALSD